MDRDPVLSSEELATGLSLIQELRPLYRIEVAFWVNFDESEYFRLCLASSDFGLAEWSEIKHQIGRVAMDQDSLLTRPITIEIVGLDDPTTVQAIALRRSRGGVTFSFGRGLRLRGHSISSIYVYSQSNLARPAHAG